MLIFFAVTPHKLLNDFGFELQQKGRSRILLPFKSTHLRGIEENCQTQQRRGRAVNVNKAFITELYERTTFVELLIYTDDSLAFSASAAAATAPGSNAFNSPSSMERSEKKPPRKDGSEKRIHELKGWGAAEALKCKRLQAESKKRAQREAYYTAEEIPFPHPACTNSNKRQWQQRERGEPLAVGTFLEAVALLWPC